MNDRRTLFGYILGFITAAICVGLAWALWPKPTPPRPVSLDQLRAELVRGDEAYMAPLPEAVKAELTRFEAVIGNADNPTNAKPHDTMLVKPHPSMVSVLRPNVSIDAFMLTSPRAINLDPPVMFLRRGDYEKLSEATRQWVDENTRMRRQVSTDADGHRTTLPPVSQSTKVLVVGDSVPFGVSVNDADTVASQLQKRGEQKFQVVNAAVGGYSNDQVLQVVEREFDRTDYAAIVYVACQNDFMLSEDWAAEVPPTFAKLKQLADGRPVVILLHTYLQPNIAPILLEFGWEQDMLDKTQAIRDAARQSSAQHGFTHLDWTDIVRQYREEAGTVFSPFALYVDHCHLSAAGNALASQAIHEALPAAVRGQ